MKEIFIPTRIKYRQVVLWFLLALCVCAMPFREKLYKSFAEAVRMTKDKNTTADRVAEYGTAVRTRLKPFFDGAGVAYPPKQATLLGIKVERRLEVWVSGTEGKWCLLKSYPILGMSGTLGPKLREGDRQVPEGLYRLESLNPNSRYHLALRVNYPNADDRRRGTEDGREYIGSDIMIHGKECSIGCLAMGDLAAEELFVLAAETGIENITIILSPSAPVWIGDLYARVKTEMDKLKR